jgi:hypothetical protein
VYYLDWLAKSALYELLEEQTKLLKRIENKSKRLTAMRDAGLLPQQGGK